MAVILVIDDNDTVRKTLRRQLLSAGYEVIEAADGAQGLALCHAHRPALVISDIFMPEADGIETITAIRREHPGIKIIAVSGSEAQQRTLYLGAAQKLGADAVLGKPWRAAELKETVQRLLGA